MEKESIHKCYKETTEEKDSGPIVFPFELKKPLERSDEEKITEDLFDLIEKYKSIIKQIIELVGLDNVIKYINIKYKFLKEDIGEEEKIKRLIERYSYISTEREKLITAIGNAYYQRTDSQLNTGEFDTLKQELETVNEKIITIRNRLVEHNVRLALSFAINKYYSTTSKRPINLTIDDIVQTAIIGLIKGVDHFDPGKGTKLSTCITQWIKTAIQREIDSHSKIARVPTETESINRKLYSKRASLTQKLEREPTPAELAESLGIKVNDIKSADAAQKISIVYSLDDPVKSLKTKGRTNAPFSEIIADPSNPNPEHTIIEDLYKKELINTLKRILSKQEFDIIKIYYGLEGEDEHTYQYIGEKLGISKEAVRQKLNNIIYKLKQNQRIKILKNVIQ